MTHAFNLFRRPSEGHFDIKRIEKSIDGTREYVDLWGYGIVQLEKNLEAGTTSLYVHSEDGSKKIRLTRTTSWFDRIVEFDPYEDIDAENNYKVVHLAPNDGIYITIGEATTIVFDRD